MGILMNHELHFDEVYVASPDEVWQALTDPPLLAKWMMDNDFEATVGKRFTFRADPVPGWDGVVECNVIDVEPGVGLSYTWVGRKDMPETIVTWSLAATADGTRLTLSHTGFHGVKYGVVGSILKRGWRRMLREALPRILFETFGKPAAL